MYNQKSRLDKILETMKPEEREKFLMWVDPIVLRAVERGKRIRKHLALRKDKL